MFTLHNGDCLQVMPTIPSGSIDAIITDLPYGTTACEWDSVIPLAPMWKQVKRLLKPNGVFVTTASQPFTSALIMSDVNYFKYEIVWDKQSTADFLLAKYQPMKYHENILVFGNGKVTYNPQMWKGNKNHGRSGRTSHFSEHIGQSFKALKDNLNGEKYPRSIIEFMKHTSRENLHQAQKPLDLYRYLIRTYTNEGETVLDICMGSGTTIEAAEIEGRNSIGIEKEIGYFQIAEKRAKSAALQPSFFTPSNNRLHHDGGYSPAQQALFTPEERPAPKGKATPARRR